MIKWIITEKKDRSDQQNRVFAHPYCIVLSLCKIGAYKRCSL